MNQNSESQIPPFVSLQVYLEDLRIATYAAGEFGKQKNRLFVEKCGIKHFNKYPLLMNIFCYHLDCC